MDKLKFVLRLFLNMKMVIMGDCSIKVSQTANKKL